MRLCLLILLLMALCVSGGIFDGVGSKVKDLLSGGKTLGEKIKNATKKGFSKFLNVTRLVNIREKFDKLRDKIKKTLQLSPERLAALKEKLSKLKPMKREKVHEEGDSIEEINEKSEVDGLLFQSDIVLTPEQAEDIAEDIEEQATGKARKRRQAYKDRTYEQTLWKDGVNYYFDSSTPEKVRSVFRKATWIWGNNTCIDFRESSAAPHRIRVVHQKGCWSYVGNLRKEQDVCLGKGCETIGTATHELAHALGFFHTHSRHDRNNYITVNHMNMAMQHMDQFTKESEDRNDNYGLKYDWGSNVHYGAHAGTINGGPVLVPNDVDYMETLGSRFLSFYDIVMMNKHYRCLDKCKNYATYCENRGIRNPRNCNECLCPLGYSGKFCAERPQSVNSKCQGKTVTATQTYQNLTITLGKEGKDEQEEFEQCFFWIESPPNTQLEVRVAGLNGTYPNDGCPYAGVELKMRRDPRLTGRRLCSSKFVGRSWVSKTNRTVVMGYSNKGLTTIELQYRFVTDGKPGPTPSTPKPKFTFNTPRGWKCEDQSICNIIKSTVCDPKSLTYDIDKKARTCPKACGLC
ncbi:hypothetical protein Q1695_014277 [Nippostrongylus brasiliensis]|nr:hypothetical protein Q1695_014276 [Nippostrongylus brasiliensis]WKX99266.1 hypothetical protein Q1695_014277 [Nippostrongylus brasiliensis]